MKTRKTQKQNVTTFDLDASENKGYLYTNNASFSSIVSNKRLTDESERIIRRLMSQGQKVETVLDIGCGDGAYTGELASRLPEIAFAGFDPAEKAVQLARMRFPGCNFVVGDILDRDTFPNEEYDLAVIRGVIHHLPAQKEAIANAMSLSRRLLIIEPNGNNPILKVIEKTSRYHVEHEEQSFSSSFFLKIACEQGLKVSHLGFVGFVPFFFPTQLARTIYFCQPTLERIPLLAKFLGGQIVLLVERT